MPLVTKIERAGENVTPANGWTGHALSAFLTAGLKETDPEFLAAMAGESAAEQLKEVDGAYLSMEHFPIYYMAEAAPKMVGRATTCPLWKGGTVTVTEHHRYGPEDHEVLSLEPGDKLSMWRESSS